MMSGGVGQLVMNGPLILAVPVAAAAGAITFASPCCLPLIPGYLSYLTGMSGAGASAAEDTQEPAGGVSMAAGPARARGRTVAGAALFVAGFSALFASYGAAFGGLGATLLVHQRGLIQVLGGLTISLGLLFAGAAMGLSSVSVVTNSLRLLRFRDTRPATTPPIPR
jgi:cytochrome c-type biogenesis protein